MNATPIQELSIPTVRSNSPPLFLEDEDERALTRRLGTSLHLLDPFETVEPDDDDNDDESPECSISPKKPAVVVVFDHKRRDARNSTKRLKKKAKSLAKAAEENQNVFPNKTQTKAVARTLFREHLLVQRVMVEREISPTTTIQQRRRATIPQHKVLEQV